MSHRTIKANLDTKWRCLFLWWEGRDLRAVHDLCMAERLSGTESPFLPGASELNLYFGSIAVQRWSIVQSMWLKASSVMVKLDFSLNIEYLLFFHHHSRSGDQATGQHQPVHPVTTVCVQCLHAAWTMALGPDFWMAGCAGIHHKFTNYSDSAFQSSFYTAGVEKLQLHANMETGVLH